MTTVLVTGLTGFTGQYLSAELRRSGHEAVGLSAGQDDAPDVPFACDLNDRAKLTEAVQLLQPNVVVHLAAVSSVGFGDVEAMYRTNVVGARNLLESLASCTRTPDLVVLASSANIYGNTSVDPITESVPPMPANDYAVSKLAMEHMARLWMARLPIVIARPFNYTGVGQSVDFLLPKIVDHFRRRKGEIELGNIDVARDFSDVRTIVDAYVRLLSRARPGETFNLCSGRSTSLREVLDIMERIAGYAIRVSVNPRLVREGEIKKLRGSNAKLTAAIGDLKAIDLEETLAWMFGTTDR
jgi:GDP-6-deoxy-D-talose 4-dehydrogenase